MFYGKLKELKISQSSP